MQRVKLDQDNIKLMLKALREMREKYPDEHGKGKIRTIFNEACDRLDVLESKLQEYRTQEKSFNEEIKEIVKEDAVRKFSNWKE